MAAKHLNKHFQGCERVWSGMREKNEGSGHEGKMGSLFFSKLFFPPLNDTIKQKLLVT